MAEPQWGFTFRCGFTEISGTYGPFANRDDAESASAQLAKALIGTIWSDSSTDCFPMCDGAGLLVLSKEANHG